MARDFDGVERRMTGRPALLPWAGLLALCLWAAARHSPRADEENTPAPSPADAVPVEGIVTYDGPLPAPIPVDEAATVRHLVEVDPATNALNEAVVWLEGVPAATEPRARKRPVLMDQRNFFFLPHALAIDAGQEVEFLNSDVANHGITASSIEPRNCFNQSLALGGSYRHRFVASSHPVAIGCPVHASMSAWIYVFAHPYHDVTDKQGHFRLPPVPSGRYTVQVRHADGGLRKQAPVVARAGETVRLRIDFHEADLTNRDRAGRSPGR
jgi:plastocyanin